MSTRKVFFSYSRSDSHFALRLAKDLRDAGADIWIDQMDIPAGNHWDAAVEKALESAACVLVVLTPASTASANVMDEVSYAIETRKRIIPVLLENCLIPFRLRRLQWVDFTTDYDTGLVHLIQSLNLTILEEAEGSINPLPEELLHMPEAGSESAENENLEKENQLWEEARKVHTLSAYKKYLNESLTHTHKSEALLLIKQLEDKEEELEALLWQKAKRKNEVGLFRHYLQEYPDGHYKTLAIAAISNLEKIEKPTPSISTLKEKSQEKIMPLLEKASGIYKNNKKVVLGLLAMTLLLVLWGNQKLNSDKRDLKSWNAALLKNDSTAYATYQHSFPNGSFSKQAREKLDSITRSKLIVQDSLMSNMTTALVTDTIALTSIETKTDTAQKTFSSPKPKVPGPAKPKVKYALGQQFKGGIIFFINSTGEHGLIASNNEGVNLTWIKAQQVCEVYTIGAYSDWRMPSISELNIMYKNRSYLGQYSKGTYWSTTEESKNHVWTQNFANGTQSKSNKTSEFTVRAVRSF